MSAIFMSGIEIDLNWRKSARIHEIASPKRYILLGNVAQNLCFLRI